MKLERCPGCGAEMAAVDGPVHRYMESSPSCWAAFGEVLAREYGDASFMAGHRLTVDAYAVQHPGRPSRQSAQSVAVHLISLLVMLEQQVPHHDATRLIRRAAEEMNFEWLEPPAGRGAIVVTDVLAACSARQHLDAVRNWAGSAWQAWALHHPRVRAWAAGLQAR